MRPLLATKPRHPLRKIAPLLTAAPLALLTACGYSTSVTWTGVSPHPLRPRPPESVEILAGSPRRPHVGIAIIEVAEESGSYDSITKELLAELRRVAAEQGCDAVSIGGLVNKGAGVEALFNDFAADRQGVTAICIVYTDAPGSASGSAPVDARVGAVP